MVGRQHMALLHSVATQHRLIRNFLRASIYIAGPTSGNQHKQIAAFHRQTENMQPLRTLSWVSTHWFKISCALLLEYLEKYSRPTEISMEMKLDNFK